MNNKTWCISFLILTVLALAVLGGATAVVDPFFHYHGPLEGLAYPIDDQRYQNDGIVKHFDYDAIITGTSMTENFKTTECDALFGVQSVKTSFSGASNKELADNLQRAIAANPEIRLVIRGIDGWTLTDHKDYLRTDAEFPNYLYDDRLLNDVQYVLNKQVLFERTVGVLQHTAQGMTTTTFDEYSNWNDWFPYGKEAVLQTYPRPERAAEVSVLTEELAQTVRESVLQNLVQPALDNPHIRFYYFFTPYNVLHMDRQDRQGILERQFQIYTLTSSLMVDVENIHLFSFFDAHDITTNLDYYRDVSHYSEDINSLILEKMAAGEHRLTKENYLEHWSREEAYYTGYPFDMYFEETE